MNEPWEDKQDREMREMLNGLLEKLRNSLVGDVLEMERKTHIEIARWRGLYARSAANAVMYLLVAYAFCIGPHTLLSCVGAGGFFGTVIARVFAAQSARWAIQGWLGTLRKIQDVLQKMEGKKPTFVVAQDGKSITCLTCNMTSYHPEDVKNLYCGNCHRFHER